MKLSKKTIIILLIISLCAGTYAVYAQANRIFPVDADEVHAIAVINEETKGVIGPWRQHTLENEDLSNFIQNINKLKSVKKEIIGHVISGYVLDEADYSVRIIYEYEKNHLRKNSVAWLYFYDDGKIIVDCGGYTEYHTSSSYYPEFLIFLEEMAAVCDVEGNVSRETIAKI